MQAMQMQSNSVFGLTLPIKLLQFIFCSCVQLLHVLCELSYRIFSPLTDCSESSLICHLSTVNMLLHILKQVCPMEAVTKISWPQNGWIWKQTATLSLCISKTAQTALLTSTFTTYYCRQEVNMLPH